MKTTAKTDDTTHQYGDRHQDRPAQYQQGGLFFSNTTLSNNIDNLILGLTRSALRAFNEVPEE